MHIRVHDSVSTVMTLCCYVPGSDTRRDCSDAEIGHPSRVKRVWEQDSFRKKASSSRSAIHSMIPIVDGVRKYCANH